MPSNNFAAIPAELRQLNQWVCWRGIPRQDGKIDKPPLNPLTGWSASVADPQTWSTFDNAVDGYSRWVGANVGGIGFVFTQNDPFVGIDLDDAGGDAELEAKQLQIYNAFDSYTERSPSGRGAHIIVKGFTQQGFHPHGVGVFYTNRFFAFTGDVIRSRPIVDYQAALDDLVGWIKNGFRGASASSAGAGIVGNGAASDFAGLPQLSEDMEIYERAANAANGEAFLSLWRGQWNERYPSQSEADFALINMLGFYTKNVEQVARLFRLSALGQRDKAKRDKYILDMVQKSFDKDAGVEWAVNLSGLRPGVTAFGASSEMNGVAYPFTVQTMPPGVQSELNASQPASAGRTLSNGPWFDARLYRAEQEFEAPNVLTGVEPDIGETVGTDEFVYTFPPGLVGDIAQFNFEASPKPILEISLGGALATMAGLSGNFVNFMGGGCNLYMVTVADSGRGKEAVALCMDKLFKAVAEKMVYPITANQTIIHKYRGPGSIASPSALSRHLAEVSNCFVSVIGECGTAFELMSNPHASEAIRGNLALILDLYAKSGFNQVLHPRIYSDKLKNIPLIASPSMSFIGDTTPLAYRDSFNSDSITSGLIPRLIVIHYDGPAVNIKKGFDNVEPSDNLIKQIRELLEENTALKHKNSVCNAILTPDADKLSDRFESYCTDKINASSRNEVSGIWNRAHLNASRVASIVARGIDISSAVITPEIFAWARNLVAHNVVRLERKFERGEIGNDLEVQQLATMKEHIIEYFAAGAGYETRYDLPSNLFNAVPRVMPYAFFNRRSARVSCFFRDRQGATVAIVRAVTALLNEDFLQTVKPDDIRRVFGTSSKCFALSNPMIIYHKRS